MKLSQISRNRSIEGIALMMFVMLIALAACAAPDSPAAAVENYLRTRVTGDEAKLVAVVCKARESEARTEAASFKAMNGRIDRLTCKPAGEEGQFTIVTCEGVMFTTYQGESPREWNLGARAYKALQEDGSWKVCGQK